MNTKNESFNVTEGLVRLNKDNYRKPTIEKDGIFNVYRDLEHCPVKCVWISDDETKNDNIVCVKVPLGTTAYRFMPGERIRVQICSGCHPRWMRNYGTKESVNDLANVIIIYSILFLSFLCLISSYLFLSFCVSSHVSTMN